jgi:hypothetical protein
MESCTLAGTALVSTRARGNCGTLRLGGRQIGRDAVAHEQLSSRILKLPHCGSIPSHTNLEQFFRLLRVIRIALGPVFLCVRFYSFLSIAVSSG